MKEHNVLQNFSYIIGKINKFRKQLLVISGVHVIFASVETFLVPMLIKTIIDLINSGCNYLSLVNYIFIFFFISIVVYTVKQLTENSEKWQLSFCLKEFKKEILSKILVSDYEKMESKVYLNSYGKAMAAIENPERGLEGMIKNMLEIIILFVKVIISSVIMITLNPFLIIIGTIVVSLQFFPIDRAKKRSKKETWDAIIPLERKNFYLDYMMQNFECGKDIRLYRMADWLFNKKLKIINEMQKKVLHSRDIWIKCHFICQLSYCFQDVFLYAFLILCFLKNEISIGSFTLYIATIGTFSGSLGSLMWKYVNMRIQSIGIDDYRDFIESETLKLDRDNIAKQGCGNLFNENNEYEIEFCNVSFKYEGQDDYALKNINLKIEPGKKLAIVGLNGAGKTTLIKLLCRLYSPTSGKILINGIDISKYSKEEYFELLSPVFQNVQVYGFSIAENISMKSLSETNLETVNKCIEIVGLKDKINSLKDGVFTSVLTILDDSGIDLSGGEKQKLVMARALYKNAKIILLDEPTSALDPIAEYNQYIEFDKIINNKTAIYISHRLSSTRFCDYIAMFRNGEIVEFGTYNDLMHQEGEYSKLYNIQAQYYK